MATAAPMVAQKFGVDERVSAVKARDPNIRQVKRNEAIADMLEALAKTEPETDTSEADLLARIEAIDGIGAKTVELIRAGLAEPEAEIA